MITTKEASGEGLEIQEETFWTLGKVVNGVRYWIPKMTVNMDESVQTRATADQMERT